MVSPARSRFDWVALGLLVLVVLAFFWRIILLGEVLVPVDILWYVEPWSSEQRPENLPEVWNVQSGDGITQQLPEAAASARAWKNGPPLWDPTVLTGMPALATGRAWTSPLILALGQVVSAERTLSLATLGYVLIGAISFFLLLGELGCGRWGSLAGSFVFALNPYFVGWFSHSSLVGAWVWIPLVFFGFEAALRRCDRRYVVLGGVAFAIQIAAGFFLWPLFTGITVALYSLGLAVVRVFERRSWRAVAEPVVTGAGIGALGIGLSAPLWLLTAELFSRTERTADIFAGLCFPIVEMARMAIPHLWGLPIHGNPYVSASNFVEANFSVGVVSLVLATLAIAAGGRRKPLIITAIGLVAFLAIFGIPPARQLVSLVDPTFAKTNPGRWFYVSAFGLAIAAGIGIDWVLRHRVSRVLKLSSKILVSVVAGGVVLAALFRVGGAPGFFSWSGVPSTLLDPSSPSGRGLLLAASMLVCLAVVLRASSSPRTYGWLGPALVGLVVIELFSLGAGFNSSFPAGMLDANPASIDAIAKVVEDEDHPFRLINVPSGQIIPGQIPMMWEFNVPTGYSSWLLHRYARYTDLIPGKTGGPIQVYFDDCAHPLLDALNTEYVYAPEGHSLMREGGRRFDQRLDEARISSRIPGAVDRSFRDVDGESRSVITTAGATTVTFQLFVPEGGRLKTAVWIEPEAWPHSDGMGFRVLAAQGPREKPRRLFWTYLDPKSKIKHRRFVPVEVDLSEFEGSQIHLTLKTNSGPNRDAVGDLGGWVEPKIVEVGQSSLELVHDGPNRLFRNPRALPRAWLVRRVIEVDGDDLDAVSRELGSPSFDPSSMAVVEGRLGGLLGEPLPGDGVRVVDFGAERVELEVRTDQPALLVLSEMFYPGWHVEVDGEERPIFATNMIMRGVEVDAASSRVVFSYRPAGLRPGLCLSFLTAAGCLLIVLTAGKRKGRKQKLRDVGNSGPG